jgi:diguanylate cyclase (GGDEF)-like protein/PAS domain S-box-containing protein
MPFSHLESLGHDALLALLHAIPQPIFIKNAAGQLVYVNQAWSDHFSDGDSNTAPLQAFTPEQLQSFADQDLDAFQHGESSTTEDVFQWDPISPPRHVRTVLAPVFDATGQPAFLIGTSLDITDQHRLQQQNAAERSMLEMLASNVPLADIMSEFILQYEAIYPGVVGSVLLTDESGKRLLHGAAPSLPTVYNEAIHNIMIGPSTGSCGTAAYTGTEIVVSDIMTHPLWTDFRELASEHGLRACWSMPIRSTKGVVIGTFANYYREVRCPTDAELQAARRSAYLLSLAVESRKNEEKIQRDQQALTAAGLYRQAMLDSMVDGLVTVDRSGRIHSLNNAACKMMGRDAHTEHPHYLSDLLGATLLTDVQGHLDILSAAENARGSTIEIKGMDRSGLPRPISLSVSRIPSSQPETFVVVLRDITQQRLDEEEIRRLAFYDPLTNLPNRRLLIDRVRQAMLNSNRLGRHGALMFLDLDHFKLLNDTLGHDVGDDLLRQVASRLRQCVREGDSVARLGGDEFVVLLENLSPSATEAANHAEVVAHKILELLSQPYYLRGRVHSSTPSIGIVVFLGEQDSMDELLKKADVAMYQAKSAGRNTARFFDPVMQAVAANNAALAQEIKAGIERSEFVLHYQAQIDTRGQCTGAEALVRWNHPAQGLVAPASFIPLAEDTGAILALGQWVLETACAQLVAWSLDPGTAPWTLAVNVSALQLAQPGFVDSVRRALHNSGAPAQNLKLELTESMLVHDVESIIAKMVAIKSMGVSFSLDDFGTGYSSLSYLKRLPLSQLKIDQSFVRDVLTDPSDAVIARTIVALGHSLGLTVIAEGVETIEQRNVLADMQCDAFQGYFFGRPVPAAGLTARAIIPLPAPQHQTRADASTSHTHKGQ